MTLAIVILTNNEEKNIVDVIKNARQCTDEILIIDSGSTDKTVELAKKCGAKVFYRAWTDDFAAQRNFALDKTAADFIFYIDADERLTAKTAEHVKKIVAQGNLNLQYKVQRKSIAFGVTFNHGVLQPDYVLRMFPRGKVQWSGKVHERPICPCEIQTLQGYLEHYTYTSWSQWQGKSQLYSTIWAEAAFKSGKKTSRAGAFLHASAGFFKMFFLKAGFLDGWYGFFTCANHFFNTMIKYLKLLELQEKNKQRGNSQ